MQRLSYTCIVSTRDRDEVHDGQSQDRHANANVKHCHGHDNVKSMMEHANVKQCHELDVVKSMMEHAMDLPMSSSIMDLPISCP
jgi:hypothetical protein